MDISPDELKDHVCALAGDIGERSVAAFRAHSDFPVGHVATFGFVPGVSWSDHLSSWRQGYRALMVTDTAFYRYPYYHTPAGTPNRLNYPAMARVTSGLCGPSGSWPAESC